MQFLIERAVPEDYLIVADVIQSVWQQIQQKDWFVADDSEYTCHTLKEGNGIGYKAFEKDSGALAGVFLAALPGNGEENLGRDIGLPEIEREKSPIWSRLPSFLNIGETAFSIS